MKKLIDNFAMILVVLLFGVVIFLVVRYNMIGESSTSSLVVLPEEQSVEPTKQKDTYLKSLESYGEDVDVEVDPTKETHKNTVKVSSELTKDDLEAALKTDEKKSYLKSLESYSDEKESKVKTEKLEDVKPEKVKNNDTIGDELDSILGE